MRHKRILNIAEDQPDASLREIADEVPTATTELVENVLGKYGDPAADAESTAPDASSNGSSPSDGADLEEVTEVQRETLRGIAKRPDATQRELAEHLDVAPATVSSRVNAIEGFEWEDREAFVADVVEMKLNPKTNGHMSTPDTERDGRIEQFDERLSVLEDRVADRADDGAFEDADLVHKVVHACMDAETIDEDEELRILETILR